MTGPTKIPVDAERTLQHAVRWTVAVLEPDWRYDCDAKQWLQWDGHRWQAESTIIPAVMHAIDRIQTEISTTGRTDMYRWACRLGDRYEQIARGAEHMPGIRLGAHQLDTHDTVLATPDGDLHLHPDGTWAVESSDPALHITRRLAVGPPADRDPTSPWWRWLEWLTRGDTTLADYLAETVAAALSVVRTQQLWVLEGGGGNGKTTLGNLLRATFGDYAAVTPRGLLTAGRDTVSDEVAALRGTRLLVDEESRSGDRLDEAKVKQLTGSAELTVRHLYGRWHQIRWTAGILHLTNALPEVGDMSEGMWRRLRRVPLTATIDRQDPSVEEELHEHLDQVLWWVLDGYRRLRSDGFTHSQVVRDATADYHEQSDAVGQWRDECCHVAPGLTGDAGALWRSWHTWAKDNGRDPGTQTAFGRRLAALGHPAVKGTKGARSRQGIGPVDNSDGWGGR